MALSSFQTSRRVEFADTDLAGICHFARYLVFMETAEHQFLEAIGTTVHTTIDGHSIGWPRVSISCDYLSPAKFGDEIDITVRVARKGNKSITWEHELTVAGRRIAIGRVTAICCRLVGEGGLESIPVPPSIADQLEQAPESELAASR